MAKAVIAAAADLLEMRDWQALTLVNPDGSRWLSFGPMSSVKEAEKLAKSMAIGGRFGITTLYSVGHMRAACTGKAGLKGFCGHAGCGHPPWAHAFDAASRGRCVIGGCACPKFCK
ncbi:hypothetical protein Afil01_61910 [Actinorhabdospora filicis]|uniref:Uncharacterized protein n=1 Tax=Actinorhabdospora filicis TaxID=1785913 RepID=A0A9W6SSY2_9ACTN|nr:hypothetical protein [Actinorhabdospora filicis]GLZ81384.1 hypothetical protein Afil01_61910 [Actinorhabdospora filicis]